MKLFTHITCLLLPYLAESIIIQRFTPGRLSGFVTNPLTPDVLRNLNIQFRRGAFADYMPVLLLELNSTRFLGASPVDVRVAMDEEHKKEPFIVLDGRTAVDGSVWYVDRYVDDLYEGEPRESWEQFIKDYCVNVRDGERVLLKVRMKIIDIPEYWGLLEDGELDILGDIPMPYDPHDSTVPAEPMFDWDTDPPDPGVPSIVAAPSEFESTTDPAITHQWLIPGHEDRHPDRCVRLKADIARQNRLMSRWTIIKQPYEGSDSPKGSIVLEQPWDTRGPRPVDVQRRTRL